MGGVFDFKHHLFVLVLWQSLEFYLGLVYLDGTLGHIGCVVQFQLASAYLACDNSAELSRLNIKEGLQC